MGMGKRLKAEAMVRLMGDMSRAELGDPRRTSRAVRIMGRMGRKPSESLPQALVTDAELEGAYRFFNNDDISFSGLMEAHTAAVAKRAVGKGPLLAIHDTTTCQYAHGDPEEMGYLPTGKAGFLLHLTLLADVKDWRRPLGIVNAEPLRREERSRRGKGKKSGSETAKWKDKESARWLRGVQATEERMKGKAPIIHVADRESDQYALMSPMVEAGQRFVFRAKHDRVVETEEGKRHVREWVERAEAMLEREVPLSGRLAESAPVARKTHPPRKARVAKLKVASTTADLRRPQYCEGMPASATVNVVHVFETEAPEGQTPVDWLLYTTEPVATKEDIATVVDYYRARWLIEELNKALKTGCVVQQRYLESYEALLNMLALSLPIAVELLALRSLARTDSSRPSTDIFTRGQLAALRHLSHRPVPSKATVKDVLWCIAGLGGHIKNNGEPGWQVLQRGMNEFLSFAAGWCARDAAEM